MGVPFPRLVVGDLQMVLSTPFQRLDRLVRALDLPHVAPVPRYSLDVWWGRKVYRATWNGDDDLKTHKLDRGPWLERLFDVAEASLIGPGEVELRRAIARVAYLPPTGLRASPEAPVRT